MSRASGVEPTFTEIESSMAGARLGSARLYVAVAKSMRRPSMKSFSGMDRITAVETRRQPIALAYGDTRELIASRSCVSPSVPNR